MPGITTAFMEMKEDKSGQRAIIQISDDIKGNIFAHVMEFLYTGNYQMSVASGMPIAQNQRDTNLAIDGVTWRSAPLTSMQYGMELMCSDFPNLKTTRTLRTSSIM